MSAVTLQIAIMVAVLGSLVWLATRRSRPRGAQRPPDGHSWSSDAVYNTGQHHGGGGYDAGAGHSAGAGDSGGGSDGGGGGGSDSGGGGGSD